MRAISPLFANAYGYYEKQCNSGSAPKFMFVETRIYLESVRRIDREIDKARSQGQTPRVAEDWT